MSRWLLALGLAACNQVYGIDSTSIANDNPRTVLFDNSASPVDLVDMAVPLFLDDTRLDYSHVTDPMTDLRFHDPDTDTELPFEVEQWNPLGESVVWVRVPTIDAGSKSDRILMYFGADAEGRADASEVWTEYELVAHGNAGQFQSAPRPVAATPTAVTSAPGAVGSAYQFGLGEHQIEYASSRDLLSGTAFTAEMWLYADYANSAALNGEPGIIDLRMPLTGGRLFDIPEVAEFVVMQIDVHFAGDISYSPTFVPLRKWVGRSTVASCGSTGTVRCHKST